MSMQYLFIYKRLLGFYQVFRETLNHPVFKRYPLPTLWRFFWYLLKKRLPGQRDTFRFKIVRWGVKMEAPRKGFPYYRHVVYQEYEEPGLLILEQFLGLGKVFIDVGANIGIYTLVASRLVGMPGRILSFEPESEAFILLQRNVALNGLTNVKTYKVALGDKDGTARLYRHPYLTMHSLGLGQGNMPDNYEEVQIRTLDSMLFGEE